MEDREMIEALLQRVAANFLNAVYFEYDSMKRLTISEHEYSTTRELSAADLKALATRLNVIADLMIVENPDA